MRRLVAFTLVALVAACASESATGTRIRRNDTAAPGDDDDVVAAPPVVVDAGPNIAPPVTVPDTGPPPSRACDVQDLAFCFTFEGTTDDQSVTKLKPATVINITYVAGHENQSASFTATSALRFAPNAAFELPPKATLEAWLWRQNTGVDSVVFDDDGRFSLTIDSTANVLCKSSGGAVTGTTVIPPEKWSHVACVVDQGTLRVYLDGIEIGSGPGAIGSAPTLGAAIGGNSPDGEPYLGMIDSLRVFKTARTPAQISEAAKR